MMADVGTTVAAWGYQQHLLVGALEGLKACRIMYGLGFRGSGFWAIVLLALEVQVAARTTTHARILIGLRKFGSRA